MDVINLLRTSMTMKMILCQFIAWSMLLFLSVSELHADELRSDALHKLIPETADAGKKVPPAANTKIPRITATEYTYRLMMTFPKNIYSKREKKMIAKLQYKAPPPLFRD